MEIIIDFNLYIFELRIPPPPPTTPPTSTHFPAQIAINTYAKVVHIHTHTHRLTHIVLYYPLKLNRCWRLRAYISVILKLFQLSSPFLTSSSSSCCARCNFPYMKLCMCVCVCEKNKRKTRQKLLEIYGRAFANKLNAQFQ